MARKEYADGQGWSPLIGWEQHEKEFDDVDERLSRLEQGRPVAAARSMGDWVEISEREPEVWKTVLLWHKDWGRTFVGYRGWGGTGYLDCEDEPPFPQPTHWMALPTKGPGDE